MGATSADLVRELQLHDGLKWEPRFNVAPTQEAPIVVAGRVAKLARWGLLPSWARSASVASQFVNARSEKATTHSTYASLLRSSRCLIPTTGFYEWQRVGQLRRPHFFSARDGHLLTLAGIWNRWRSPEDIEVDTFTIFTTSASPEVAPLHDRMPVFLEAEDRDTWLSELRDVDVLEALLKPRLGLQYREVSAKVNSVANEGPELLSPPATVQLGLF